MVTNRQAAGVGAVTFLLLLAGCGGIAGGGPSVSGAEATVIDGTPAITFDYSVDDYATVLLESPDGEVINRDTVEPDNNQSALAMGQPTAGTYTLILQTDGETASEHEVTFEGGNASVTSVIPSWSGNSLQGVTLYIQNSGDLPVEVSGAEVSANGSTIESGAYEWIGPNGEGTISISPSYQAIEINEPGKVEGEVALDTSVGRVSGSFSKVFGGANISITDTSMTWDGDRLEEVTVTVENDGDLPTVVEPEVRRGSETLASARDEEIPPGESVEFEITSFGGIYKATSSGNVSLSLVANSSSGFETTELTHYIEPASVELVSMSPTWENGKLTEVTYTLENSGGAETDFSTTLSAAGEEFGDVSGSIEGDSKESFSYEATYGDYLYAATEGGSIPVEVSVTSDGETFSETETEEFDGLSTSLSNLGVSAYDQYDSDQKEVSSVTFDVANTGDTVLMYDSIRVTIDGESWTKSLYNAESLEPGESAYQSLRPEKTVSVSGGEHQLEITFLHDGEEVTTETTTVTI